MLLAGAALRADAQRPAVTVAGHAAAALTRVDPVPGAASLAELRLVQPVVMLRAAAGPWRVLATVNGEGAVMRNGELAPGIWGEGFIDRRHPHTYVHELLVSGADVLGRRDGAVHVSLAAGKGFVPFGTDDPMSRPALRYPANHHLAQILERAVAIAGVGAGPVLVEAALFNGDEPEGPAQWPSWKRFGDSWAARVSVAPLRGLELQGSVASVHSPEHRPGSGPEQEKRSASARWDRWSAGGRTYALVEWAHTSDAGGFFEYRTLAAEGELRRGPTRGYVRLERTDRPEEERTTSPYRSLRPHLDDSILGITRWTIATLGIGRRFALGRWGLSAEPVAELSAGRVRETTGGVFDPASFYGRRTFWSVTFALRVAGGMDRHRMGRYGVLPGASPDGSGHEH